MEGRGNVKPESSRSGKRPLGSRLSSGGDTQPRKLKPSSKAMPALTPSAVNSYFMDSPDVEEHFRRSFEQINNRTLPTSSPPQNCDNRLESHQITISDNSPQQIEATPSPIQITPRSSPTLGMHHGRQLEQESSPDRTKRVAPSPTVVSPHQHGAMPPLLLSLPGSSVGHKPDTMKSYNEVLSMAATQQFITAATIGQSGGGGRGLLFPSVLPTSQSSFIPVVDSNGVTQLMASPSTHSSSLPASQTVPPIIFLGPGNIPLLSATQPGMYLVNASADQSSIQQQQQSLPVNHSLSAVTTQPSYIVFPQSFQMPQTLSMEQLQALSASFPQQRPDQQQVDGRNIESTRKISSERHDSMNGDEVEEHFARALGEKWQQFKKDPNPHSKIST